MPEAVRHELTYQPSWGQHHFHMMRQRAKVRAAFGGIGSGKTCCGAIEAWDHAAEHARGATGMIIVPSYRTFDEVTMKEVRRWWPKGLWKLSKAGGGRQLTVYWGDGVTSGESQVLVRSAKNAAIAEEIRGPDIHWVWGDEPGTWGAGKAAWDIIIGRTRQMAPHNPDAMPQIWLTGSPRWGWLNKVFGVSGRMPQHAWTSGYFSKGTTRDNAFYVRAMMSEDNVHNAPGYAAFLRGEYGDAFAAQELSGDFMPPSGAVFAGFYRDLHVIPHRVAMDLYRRSRRFVGGTDWGYANPAAMEGVGIDGDGVIVVVREWSEAGRTKEQMRDVAVSRFEPPIELGGIGTKDWYCDSAEPEGIEKWQGRVAGVPGVGGAVHLADKSRKEGIETLRVAMRLESRLDHPAYPAGSGRPASWFYVSDECTGLIGDLEQYRYAEVDEGRDVDEAKTTGLDHRIDALRYAAHSAIKEMRPRGRLVRF